MKKEKKRYFLYAGYYELIISDKKLDKPYIFLSWHKSLKNTVFAATKYDSEVNLVFGSEEIRKDYIDNVIECPWIYEDDGWEKQYPLLSA